MLDLVFIAGFFLILGTILYGIYRIPSVKRAVRRFKKKRWDLLVTLVIGMSAALLLYFIILPKVA